MRDAGGGIFIQNAKIGDFDFRDQMFAAYIVVAGMPGFMMTVPITENQAVAEVAAQNGADVRKVASGTSRSRRDVNAEDGDWRIVDCSSDPKKFDVAVVLEEGDVDWCEGD